MANFTKIGRNLTKKKPKLIHAEAAVEDVVVFVPVVVVVVRWRRLILGRPGAAALAIAATATPLARTGVIYLVYQRANACAGQKSRNILHGPRHTSQI
jgi:hypothetical protein